MSHQPVKIGTIDAFVGYHAHALQKRGGYVELMERFRGTPVCSIVKLVFRPSACPVGSPVYLCASLSFVFFVCMLLFFFGSFDLILRSLFFCVSLKAQQGIFFRGVGGGEEGVMCKTQLQQQKRGHFP